MTLLTLGLATISAYAKSTTIRAPDDLEVSLSTPADKVASASEIRVVAAVKDVGDKDLKVIKFGTVLDNSRPTRSFLVTKDGKEVPFAGIKVCVYSTRHPPDLLCCSLMVAVPIGLDFHRQPPRRSLGCHPLQQECDCRTRW